MSEIIDFYIMSLMEKIDYLIERVCQFFGLVIRLFFISFVVIAFLFFCWTSSNDCGFVRNHYLDDYRLKSFWKKS